MNALRIVRGAVLRRDECEFDALQYHNESPAGESTQQGWGRYAESNRRLLAFELDGLAALQKV